MSKTVIKVFKGKDLYELTNTIQKYADENNLKICNFSTNQDGQYYSILVLLATNFIYDI